MKVNVFGTESVVARCRHRRDHSEKVEPAVGLTRRPADFA
jgi:hypothetical protein